MAILSREQILAVADIVIEEVKVPEWGGSVCVKTLTAAERDRLAAGMAGKKADKSAPTPASLDGINARLAAASMCDAEGRRLFSDGDVESLGKKSATALQRILNVIYRLSALSDEVSTGLADGLKNDLSDGSIFG